MLWLPGRLSDMARSPALTPDPPLGAKVLMARATIAAYTASSCDLRAVWTYKGKWLTEAGGEVGAEGAGEGAGEGVSQGQQIYFK